MGRDRRRSLATGGPRRRRSLAPGLGPPRSGVDLVPSHFGIVSAQALRPSPLASRFPAERGFLRPVLECSLLALFFREVRSLMGAVQSLPVLLVYGTRGLLRSDSSSLLSGSFLPIGRIPVRRKWRPFSFAAAGRSAPLSVGFAPVWREIWPLWIERRSSAVVLAGSWRRRFCSHPFRLPAVFLGLCSHLPVGPRPQ